MSSFSLRMLRRSSAVLLLLVATGCSTMPNRHALGQQILKPRPGHAPFLTNKALEKDETGDVKMVIREYDLRDEKFRALAQRLKFVCKLGKKRYRICKNKPGLCRQHFTKKKRFLKKTKTKRKEEYLPIVAQYNYLLAVKAKCFSIEFYNFGLM